MAITARKLLHGGAAGTIAQGVADVGGIGFSLWEMVTGFFADILAGLFAALAGAAHLLVLPLELLWQSLVTVVTAAAGTIASGLNGLWQHVTGFFAHIVAGIADAAHQLVLPLETLWQWLATSMADAVSAISSALDGPWQIVAGFLPGAWAALVGAAHEIPRKLAELWRWLQAAAPVALPYVLVVAAVVLVLALVCFCWPALLAAGVGVGQALVIAACLFGRGLFYVCSAFAFLLPSCMQCLNCAAGVTMNAPGAAGMLISRAAFEAAPALFFALMRAAPPIVATTVFCTKTVALLVGKKFFASGMQMHSFAAPHIHRLKTHTNRRKTNYQGVKLQILICFCEPPGGECERLKRSVFASRMQRIFFLLVATPVAALFGVRRRTGQACNKPKCGKY